MSMSLYDICFDYLKQHTDCIVDLHGTPYRPFIENILLYLFTSDTPLHPTILPVIGQSHGPYLSSSPPEWTSLHFSQIPVIGSSLPALKYISTHMATYITQLDMSTTDIEDDDISLLNGFLYLTCLDLSSTAITDRTLSYLALMNQAREGYRGLPKLSELYLNNNHLVTDKCLKYLGKMESLTTVDLTGTQVTPQVILIYFRSLNFNRLVLPDSSDIRYSHYNHKLHHSMSLWITDSMSTRSCPPSVVHSRTQLLFKRTASVKRTMTIKETPTESIPKAIKRPKLSVLDYLTMVENEILEGDQYNLITKTPSKHLSKKSA